MHILPTHGGILILLWIDLFFNRVRFTPDTFTYLVFVLVGYTLFNYTVSILYKPIYIVLRWQTTHDFFIGAQLIVYGILNYFAGKYVKEKITNY